MFILLPSDGPLATKKQIPAGVSLSRRRSLQSQTGTLEMENESGFTTEYDPLRVRLHNSGTYSTMYIATASLHTLEKWNMPIDTHQNSQHPPTLTESWVTNVMTVVSPQARVKTGISCGVFLCLFNILCNISNPLWDQIVLRGHTRAGGWRFSNDILNQINLPPQTYNT